MEAYPLRMRRRIIALYKAGETTVDIAALVGACVSGVRRIRQRFQETGSLKPRKSKPGPKPSLDADALERLAAQVAVKSDATLVELRDHIGVFVGVPVYSEAMKKLGLTRKIKTLHASEQDRPDVAAKRATWHAELATVPVETLVFVDESGASTSMQRVRGRSAKGERCVASGPVGHWSITTLIGAIRIDGPLACATLDGPVDGDTFTAWLIHDLCPQLRRNDVVVMDNLPAHKVAAVTRAIEAAGARLLPLPPYSPDYNPIENFWSKVKEALRAAAARTTDALGAAVEAAVKTVTANDCHGFLRHSRYAM